MKFTDEKVKEINAERLDNENIKPELREKAEKLIALAKSQGFTLLVTQGYRSIAEQNALFAQGRTKPGKIVTNARGGQSMHNFGKAVDFAFVVDEEISWHEDLYWKIGTWAKAVGLKWGGDWRSIKDKPHVEI